MEIEIGRRTTTSTTPEVRPTEWTRLQSYCHEHDGIPAQRLKSTMCILNMERVFYAVED